MTAAKGIVLTEKQRLNWLRLIRSENVGPITFRSLIDHYGSAADALDALPQIAANGGKRAIRIASMGLAMKELEKATRAGIRFIGIGEPDYPPLLRLVEGAPPLLAIRGSTRHLLSSSIAIVGSRNASAAGQKIAHILALELGQHQLSIVSGLARGIDGVAHKASLKTGTIAVLAGGVDHIYPPEHKNLYDEIIAHEGAVISEMPLGYIPKANDFPRRNRIIAGLANGLVVIEAAARSGSLISARLANDIGRLVFAIPGSPLDPRATGTNNLIKEGAILVTEAKDIIDAIMPLVPQHKNNQPGLFERTDETQATVEFPSSLSHATTTKSNINNTDSERKIIYDLLTTTPVSIETLCEQSQLDLPALYLILMELDLAGKLIRHSGGFVSRMP